MRNQAFEGLEQLPIGEIEAIAVPAPVQALIDDAEACIARFGRDHRREAAFVACDARGAYRLLNWIVATGLAPGRRFCEWGSGFAVVACLAQRLGLEATGIEIAPALVAESRRLVARHEPAVRIVQGSYQPTGTAKEEVDRRRLAEELGFSPTEFDLIYAYPWPAEERLVAYLFRTFAPSGSLLAVYWGACRFALFRQPERRASKPVSPTGARP